MRALYFAMAAAAAMGFATAALAGDAIPYPTPGFVNPASYTFTATSTGHVTAYFVDGQNAGYENELGLLVNGVLSDAGFGLDNHSSNIGDIFDLGQVTAGDTLTFVMRNLSLSNFDAGFFADVYSDPIRNAPYDNIDNQARSLPGVQHVYSTAYTGSPMILPGGSNGPIPLGTYVAFEDIPLAQGPDFNYQDEVFVFTNTSINGVPTGGVPEPATWGLMLMGFGGLGAVLRRRRALALAGRCRG